MGRSVCRGPCVQSLCRVGLCIPVAVESTSGDLGTGEEPEGATVGRRGGSSASQCQLWLGQQQLSTPWPSQGALSCGHQVRPQSFFSG